MKNRVKRQKRDGRGVPILALDYCDCGCGYEQLFDVRHQQKYIKGHGGLAIMKRRKAALSFAIEVKLIALGYGVLTAARTALVALKRDWKRAREDMSKWGYDYMKMQWV